MPKHEGGPPFKIEIVSRLDEPGQHSTTAEAKTIEALRMYTAYVLLAPEDSEERRHFEVEHARDPSASISMSCRDLVCFAPTRKETVEWHRADVWYLQRFEEGRLDPIRNRMLNQDPRIWMDQVRRAIDMVRPWKLRIACSPEVWIENDRDSLLAVVPEKTLAIVRRPTGSAPR